MYNLHEILKLERPLLWFDIEGTGPNPGVDRIVELGFIQFKPDGTVKEWQGYFNPEMPIPHEATYGKPGAVEGEYQGHGISDATVQGCRHCGLPAEPASEHQVRGHDFRAWPTFAELAPNLLKGFSDTDFGGYNIRGYDLPIMAAEFERVGIKTWSWEDARIIDGYRLWQLLQPRKLGDAVEMFLGRKMEGAHRAVDDIRATLDVVLAQLPRLPRPVGSLAEVHDLCYPRDPNAIDPGGKIVWGPDGEALVNFGKKWKGKRLRDMFRRDLEWIVDKADGMSPRVKAICRDAIMGKFPERGGSNADASAGGRSGEPGRHVGGQGSLLP